MSDSDTLGPTPDTTVAGSTEDPYAQTSDSMPDLGPVRLIDPPSPSDVDEVSGSHTDGSAAMPDEEGAPEADAFAWVEHDPSAWPVRVSFNLARVVDEGEDADPLVLASPDIALLGVFDGMGGAGGTVYQTPDGPRTGAYLASRIAREAVRRSVLGLSTPEDVLDGPAMANELHRSVQQALADHLAGLHTPPSGLRSKLLRALPTTMALAAARRSPDGATWICQLLWAGDSRVYTVTSDGAHQMTLDDLRDHRDALANLREDSVVSNAMSADTPFTVNHHQAELREPFLLVAATDGCFGYVPSPMHFEELLLTCLRHAPDPETWSALLQQRIGAVTGDDASMAILGVGADHSGFQQAFAERTDRLGAQAVSVLDEIEGRSAELEERLDALREEQSHTEARLWSDYRTGYESFLPAAAAPRSSS